jgi:MscS family membrane protein
MPPEVLDLVSRFQDPLTRALVIIGVSIVLALLVRVVAVGGALRVVKATKTTADDEFVQALGKPVFVSVLLVGAGYAISSLDLGPTVSFTSLGLLKTACVVVWTQAALRVGRVILGVLSAASDRGRLVQPSTLPMFQMSWRVAVIGGAVYFAFVSWRIDVTGWMASAGIVGIAVGFAAKDTIANLFAGVFILTDAPYKVGDFIVLEGHRGLVTQIGLRSTRILTRDDIEVTVPNATIANQQIVNETGGPHDKMRVRITVSVAYGSDVDRVREVLLGCPVGVEHVCSEPAPSLRFREFGSSGLLFQLRVWVVEPVYKGRVVDAMNTKVYKELMKAGIEIPYEKRDLYVKELPPFRPQSPA